MASEPQPILDLTDLAPVRPKIRLESGTYETLSAEDFDPVRAAQMSKLGKEIEGLQEDGEDLTVEAAEKMDANIRAQIAIICPAIPAEELAALPFQKAVMLMDFFLEKTGVEDGLPSSFMTIVNKRANRQTRRNGRRVRQSQSAGKS